MNVKWRQLVSTVYKCGLRDQVPKRFCTVFTPLLMLAAVIASSVTDVSGQHVYVTYLFYTVLQTHSDDKSKSEKGRKTAKPMKIIEEDDEDAFKGGSSDKVGSKCFIGTVEGVG